MVVYSGASAVPSHLFQGFMRRRGIYCNLRRIDSAYLFRLSLCWDHRRTLKFSHKHRLGLWMYFDLKKYPFNAEFVFSHKMNKMNEASTASSESQRDRHVIRMPRWFKVWKICTTGSDWKGLFPPSRANVLMPPTKACNPNLFQSRLLCGKHFQSLK